MRLMSRTWSNIAACPPRSTDAVGTAYPTTRTNSTWNIQTQHILAAAVLSMPFYVFSHQPQHHGTTNDAQISANVKCIKTLGVQYHIINIRYGCICTTRPTTCWRLPRWRRFLTEDFIIIVASKPSNVLLSLKCAWVSLLLFDNYQNRSMWYIFRKKKFYL